MKRAIISSIAAVVTALAALLDANIVPGEPSLSQPAAAAPQIPPLGLKWYIEDLHVGEPGGSLVLDEGGIAHISYSEITEDLRYSPLQYANRVSGQWNHELVADMKWFGGPNHLKLKSNNRPFIAYVDCNLISCEGSTANKAANIWNIQSELAINISGSSLSLDLDSNDRPHLSFCTQFTPDFSITPALRHMYWSGTEWITETIDPGCWYSTSIRLDSQDHPRISYYLSESGDLKYATWTGSEWSNKTIDSAEDVGLWNDLALDSYGFPHIAYLDSTTNSLKYTKWNGQDWETQIVDQIPNARAPLSLAVDSQGRAHIAYAKFSEIWYAFWSGQHWSIWKVDSGEQPSLALNSNDLPQILYWSDNLKYARGEVLPLDKPVYFPFVQIK